MNRVKEGKVMCEEKKDVAEQVVILAARDGSRARYLTESFDPEAVKTVASPEEFLAELEKDEKISTVIVDATYWEPRELCRFGALSLLEMEQMLEAGERPVCFGLLEQLNEIRKTKRPDLLVVCHWPNPDMYVAQELLHYGADWVWPNLRGELMAQIIAKVRIIKGFSKD